MGLFGKLRLRRVLLLGSVAGLLSYGAFQIVLISPQSWAAEELAAARARWEARPFSRYRLVLANNRGHCRQEVEVEAEKVVQRIHNSCSFQPRVVSNLFTLVEEMKPSVYRCVDLGCACDTVMTAHAIYDSQLGYPLEIDFEWNVRANWRHQDFWKQLLLTGRLPQCRTTTFSRSVAVLSLAPITSDSNRDVLK